MRGRALPIATLFAMSLLDLGCTHYRAISAPPPSRVAMLNSGDGEITISRGVALGFECTTASGDPCSKGNATIDDQNVATVYPAYLNRLDHFMSGTLTPTSYVIVGVNPGETVLRIPDEDPLRVIVVE
jgi:hypothetical protein